MQRPLVFAIFDPVEVQVAMMLGHRHGVADDGHPGETKAQTLDLCFVRPALQNAGDNGGCQNHRHEPRTDKKLSHAKNSFRRCLSRAIASPILLIGSAWTNVNWKMSRLEYPFRGSSVAHWCAGRRGGLCCKQVKVIDVFRQFKRMPNSACALLCPISIQKIWSNDCFTS